MSIINLLKKHKCNILAEFFKKNNIQQQLKNYEELSIIIPTDEALNFMSNTVGVSVNELLELEVFTDILFNHFGYILDLSSGNGNDNNGKIFESINGKQFAFDVRDGSIYIDKTLEIEKIGQLESIDLYIAYGILANQSQRDQLLRPVDFDKNIIANIAMKLDFETLQNYCLTSKKWSTTCDSNNFVLWSNLIKRDFPIYKFFELPEFYNWKTLYLVLNYTTKYNPAGRTTEFKLGDILDAKLGATLGAVRTEEKRNDLERIGFISKIDDNEAEVTTFKKLKVEYVIIYDANRKQWFVKNEINAIDNKYGGDLKRLYTSHIKLNSNAKFYPPLQYKSNPNLIEPIIIPYEGQPGRFYIDIHMPIVDGIYQPLVNKDGIHGLVFKVTKILSKFSFEIRMEDQNFIITYDENNILRFQKSPATEKYSYEAYRKKYPVGFYPRFLFSNPLWRVTG